MTGIERPIDFGDMLESRPRLCTPFPAASPFVCALSREGRECRQHAGLLFRIVLPGGLYDGSLGTQRH